MGLGNLRKRRAAGQSGKRSLTIRLQLEMLERRDLLAVFLPDTFADDKAQPIGVAFNGGEQTFFTGYSGDLRIEFGQSAASAEYATSPRMNNDLVIAGPTPTWNARTLNDLLSAAADAPVGNLELYQALSASGDETQLHVVYRAAGGKIVDIGSTTSSWQSEDIVASGAVSDPEAAAFNGGRQILYIDASGRVHFVASADGGSTWNDTDLTALVGEDVNASAKAVPTSGVAAIQVGSFEYYVYHRADGGLGYFLWNGAAWGYDVLDATDLPGFIAPFNGATGAMESLSYSTSGSGNPDVGWVLFKDGAGDVRGVWLAEGGTWHSARLTSVRAGSALAAAYNPASGKVSIAYYDANSHLHLLTEGSTWSNLDYHAAPVLTMPLGNLGDADTAATFATDTITFADSSTIAVTAAFAGTAYNDIDVQIVGGGTAGQATAAYDSTTKIITVTVGGDTAKTTIATAINGLAQFDATAGGGGVGFVEATDGFGTFATLAGATDVVPGTAARPDIYFRNFASAGSSASLQILYKDMSGHVHNVRPSVNINPVVFDTTAYLEGYRSTFGYGLVNAARAVAYALGTQIPATGAPLENWNLDLVKAPDAWSSATGANAAVFMLDSGVDIDNLDLNTLAGRNVVAQTTNVTDTTGHGTGVAGIIAAKNDAGGVTGVAFDAKVVPIKVGDGSPSSETVLVNGIDYAMNYTLPGGYATATRVINLSLATTQTSSPGNVLAALRNKMYVESPDAVFVLAAGNRTQARPDFPANFAVGFGIVAGAINIDGKRWAPSNGTSTVAPLNYLLAPGVDVPTDALVGDTEDNHNTADASGTSIAAAHISGVIALMLDANPALTPREVESILIASADQVITQTVAASAPSIPATIYFAGGSDNGQIAALMTGAVGLTVSSELTTDTNEIPASPASEQDTTAPVGVAVATTKAVDEVFDAVSDCDGEELFDFVNQNDDGV
jgi:hypothetical protein